jgi:hypothetical protein
MPRAFEADGLLRSLGGRLVAALLLLAVTALGYWTVAFAVDPAHARSLRTEVDDRIPFWAWSVYVYACVYTSLLYPLFVVRCPQLFRRTLESYAITIAACLVTWALFPVTAADLRPDLATLDGAVFHDWGVHLVYFLDPPTNLFPSLHMAIAALAALVAWKARPQYGLSALPVVLGVAVAITTMKQHYVVDGFAGLALAAVVYRLRVASFAADGVGESRRAYSWRGPALFACFHGSVYLALYVAFRAGFRPWVS